MNRVQARDTAREILEIIPLVMRTVAAELRAAGEMPAPAHFGLLSLLSVRPRMLSDLASLQGVSLPTMSNSISAMVERGWVRREAPDGDRRVVMIDVTADRPRRARARQQSRRSAPRRRARAARSPVAAASDRRARRAAQGVCGRARVDVTERSQNTGEALVVCISDSTEAQHDADTAGRIRPPLRRRACLPGSSASCSRRAPPTRRSRRTRAGWASSSPCL